MILNKRIFLLSCICFALFLSCKKANIKFGDQLVDNELSQILKIDTFSTDVSTVLLDSFVASGRNIINIGGYPDPVFGKVSTQCFFELTPPTYSNDYDKTTFDSLTLFLKLNRNYFGDTSFPITINIDRVNQTIQPYDIALDNNIYNNRQFGVSTRLGQKTLFVRPNNSDTIVIRLSDVLGDTLLKILKDPNNLIMKSNDAFLDYFKGIRISTDTNTNRFIFGCQDSVKMRLHYKRPKTLYPTDQNAIVNFTVSNPNHLFNRTWVNRSGTLLNNLSTANKAIPSKATNNLGLLQGITGSMIRLRFLSIGNIQRLPNYAKLLRAELEIKPLRNSFSTQYPLPPQLILAATNPLFQIGSSLIAYSSSGTSSVQYGSLYVDNLYGENTSYQYDVTSYVRGILNDPIATNNGILLIPPTPSLQTQFNRAIINNSNDQKKKVLLHIYYIAVQ